MLIATPAAPARETCAVPAEASPVVAIMQPYLFPYLGYLGLLCAADVFVFYDDVHYIPRGWINRNRILVNGAPHTFTVPVARASQNALILDIGTHDFDAFRRHFLRQLECAYRQAAHFEAGFALVREVLEGPAPTIAELAMRSVERVARALGLERRLLRSSEHFADSRGTPRAERLIAITRALGASRYVNSPGGATLYSPAAFAAQGVSLRFVQPKLTPYRQGPGQAFVPGLSVIDALMHLPAAEVARQVRQFDLE